MDCVVKKNLGIMAYICDLVTMLSFNFIVKFKINVTFLLFQTQYHTFPYPKTNESKIFSKDKIEPQHLCSVERCFALTSTT